MKLRYLSIVTILFLSVASSSFATVLKHVINSEVCMVNDRHFGVKQIPVDVDGKIYYGCCASCKGKLKNEKTTTMWQITLKVH